MERKFPEEGRIVRFRIRISLVFGSKFYFYCSHLSTNIEPTRRRSKTNMCIRNASALGKTTQNIKNITIYLATFV